MTFFGVDPTPFKLQLKFAKIAEMYETKPHYQLIRISFFAIKLKEECDGDERVDYSQPLSDEDQKKLNWQDSSEILQDDFQLCSNLAALGGVLCPSKKIARAGFASVTDECNQQERRGHLAPPITSYRQASFRSSMLTKHSLDGQAELLFLHDGVGGDQGCLRWRSYDFMKLILCKSRIYRVFWIVQWDFADVLNLVGDHEAIGPGKRRRSYLSLLVCKEHPDPKKLKGIRQRLTRNSWDAEMRPGGTKNKVTFGNFRTPEEAARAADAAFFFYGKNDKMNFRDSPRFLNRRPPGLSDGDELKKFVKAEARRLASLVRSEDPELLTTFLPENWCYFNSTNTGNTPVSSELPCSSVEVTNTVTSLPSSVEFTSSQLCHDIGSGSNHASHIQVTNANFVDLSFFNSNGVSSLTNSVIRGSDTIGNHELAWAPSSPHGSGHLFQGTIGSPISCFPEEEVWLTPPGSFTSHFNEGDRSEPSTTFAANGSLQWGAPNVAFSPYGTEYWDGNSLANIPGSCPGDGSTDISSVGVPCLGLHQEMETQDHPSQVTESVLQADVNEYSMEDIDPLEIFFEFHQEDDGSCEY